jgi:hypothetical protein
MSQQDIFRLIHTPTPGDADTSVLAAALVTTRHRATPRGKRQIDRVLEAVKRRPMTDEELGAELCLPGNSIRPRRVDLVTRKMIRDSGNRRSTASGSVAIVWEYCGP